MKSFGSDPEFMLISSTGKYVSAIRILPSDKNDPVLKKGHGFYWDNVLAECSILPSFSKSETIENFRTCFQEYAKLVNPYFLKTQASHTFPDKEMQDEGAKRAGCDPEFCTYTFMLHKPPPDIIETTNFRTCGGHIHLGDDEGCVISGDQETAILVRMLDLFLGIPSLFMDIDPTSAARRTLYGKAGRFRIKPYGIEYRSLGNFWLSSPKLVNFIYDVCEFTVDFVNNGHDGLWKFNSDLAIEQNHFKNTLSTDVYDSALLVKSINETNLDQAKTFMPLIKKYMPTRLFNQIERLTNTYDFYKEWNLK